MSKKTFQDFLDEIRGIKRLSQEEKFESFKDYKKEIKTEDFKKLMFERVNRQPIEPVVFEKDEEKINKNKLISEINEILKEREPILEVLPWKEWLADPINKKIHLLDKKLAEEIYYDDYHRAVKHKRGKGIKPKRVGVPVIPTDIEGLKVWLDADNAADITIGFTSLGKTYISQWKSKVDDPTGRPLPWHVNWGLKQTVTNNMPRYDDHPSGRKTIHFDSTYAEHFDTFWMDHINNWAGADEWSWMQEAANWGGYPAYTVFIHGSLEDTITTHYLFDVESPRSALYLAPAGRPSIYREETVGMAQVDEAKFGEQLWTFSNVEAPKHIPTYTLELMPYKNPVTPRPPTGVTLLSTGADDVNSSLYPLDGTFTFDGVSYTQFAANSNGFITLGAFYSNAGQSYNNTRLDDPDSDVIIAPWWDDLIVDTYDVTYENHPVGTLQATVIFFDNRRYSTLKDSSFEIILYHDDHPTLPGTIEFIYPDTSSVWWRADSDSNSSYSIGVKGVTNILPGTANVNHHNWRSFANNTNAYGNLRTDLQPLDQWPGYSSNDLNPNNLNPGSTGKQFYYRFSPTVQTDEHKSKIFSDGELVASAYSTKAVDLQKQYTANRNQKVGVRHNTTYGHDGNINEMIVYDRILTADERAKVETYLAEKWGTTVATSSYDSYKHPWSD